MTRPVAETISADQIVMLAMVEAIDGKKLILMTVTIVTLAVAFIVLATPTNCGRRKLLLLSYPFAQSGKQLLTVKCFSVFLIDIFQLFVFSFQLLYHITSSECHQLLAPNRQEEAERTEKGVDQSE